MTHDCVYINGECERCEAESAIEIERAVKSQRGRWMVVQEDGTAYRYPQRSAARAHVAMCDVAGIRAWLRRWRRDRVVYIESGFGFEVTERRWCP